VVSRPANKEYDGTNTATLNTGSAALVVCFRRHGCPSITVLQLQFFDKNVGAGKTVTISGLTIGGPMLAITPLPSQQLPLTSPPETSRSKPSTVVRPMTEQLPRQGVPSVISGSLASGIL